MIDFLGFLDVSNSEWESEIGELTEHDINIIENYCYFSWEDVNKNGIVLHKKTTKADFYLFAYIEKDDLKKGLFVINKKRIYFFRNAKFNKHPYTSVPR